MLTRLKKKNTMEKYFCILSEACTGIYYGTKLARFFIGGWLVGWSNAFIVPTRVMHLLLEYAFTGVSVGLPKWSRTHQITN